MKLFSWFRSSNKSMVYPAKGPVVTDTRAVCIGLNSVDSNAYGGWSGELDDCELDATRMAKTLSKLGVCSQTVLTKDATIENVKAVLAKTVGEMVAGDLLIIHNSGHGGQTFDVSGDETDARDETVCLYDGQLLDDRINDLLQAISKPIRILWICDTCNSGTMYKGPAHAPVEFGKAAIPDGFKGQLILISGCDDGQSSQSTGNGGVATLSILKVGFGVSPRELFYRAKILAAKESQVMCLSEYGNVTDAFRYGKIIK